MLKITILLQFLVRKDLFHILKLVHTQTRDLKDFELLNCSRNRTDKSQKYFF